MTSVNENRCGCVSSSSLALFSDGENNVIHLFSERLIQTPNSLTVV